MLNAMETLKHLSVAAAAVFMIAVVFKQVLKMDVFTKITKAQTFSILRMVIIGSLVVAVLAFATYIIGIAIVDRPQKNEKANVDNFDIASVRFIDTPSMHSCPTLAIGTSNQGSNNLFVKNIRINVRKKWEIPKFPYIKGPVGVLEHKFKLDLPDKPAPFSVQLDTAVGISKDDFGLFTFQIATSSNDMTSAIYLATLDFVANSTNASFSTEPFIFLINWIGNEAPREEKLLSIARDEHNKFGTNRLNEVENCFKIVRSIKREVVQANATLSNNAKSYINSIDG